MRNKSKDLFKKIEDADMWIEAQDAKFFNKGEPYTRKEWDRLLGDYSAVSADLPASFFAEDLIQAYPESKVILVERDIESWAKSFEENIIQPLFSRLINFVSDWDPLWLGRYRDVQHRWKNGVFQAKTPDMMRANMRDIYRQHYALVRRVTPTNQLLEFQLKDGWEPLCKFLGWEIPSTPFPRVNDAVSLNELLLRATKKGATNILKRYVPWIVTVLGAGLGIRLLVKRGWSLAGSLKA